MRIKALVFLLLAPLLAWGQIAVTAPGEPIAIGRGVRLSIPAYDVDAIAYFARAGVTDATAKRQISDFVKGVKALGLWSNSVCWLLRSNQNAGTGTTAYSLGGLGTYNGTLVNGPTWGADGVTFVRASAQCILTALKLSLGSNYAAVGVAKYTNTTGDYPCLFSVGSSAATQLYNRGNGATTIYADAWNYAAGGSGAYLSSAYSTLNRHISIVTGDASSVSFWWNGTQYGIVAGDYRVGAANSGRVTIGGANNNDPGNGVIHNYNGVVSFGLVSTVKLSDDQRSSLFSLYKSTLGQGLGLP